MSGTWIKLVFALIAIAFIAPAVYAQGGVAEASHRLKKFYDFEDTDDRGKKIGFSGLLLPRNWYVIGREAKGEGAKFRKIPLHQALATRQNYPHYAEVGFDREQRFAGDFSLKLNVAGGRTGAFIQNGAVNINAGSDYRVAAMVHTEELNHSWAEVRAYFTDNKGRVIEESVRRSDPVHSSVGWQQVSVKLIGEYANAAYIGIEIHVLQPDRNPDDPLGDHQIVPSDIRGAAWFDNIAVWELPSVNLTTDTRTNILKGERKPRLHARVRDLTGKRLRSVMSVYDHKYELVDRVSDPIDKESWSWQPDLGGRYGWYWGELEIFEVDLNDQPTTQVARTLAGFLWLGSNDPSRNGDRERFRLLAEDVPTDQLPLLEELMQQCGFTGLVVSGWERGGTPQTTAARTRVLEPIMRDLIVKQGSVAVSFWPVPAELAARMGVDASDPLNVLTKPSEQWLGYAKPFLAPLGQRQTRWQLGSSTLPQASLSRDLSADLEVARRGIRAAAPSPRLIAPWRLDQPSASDQLALSDSFAVAWPQGVTHDRLAQAMSDWPAPPSGVRLDVELADAVDMTHERRIADLMLRVLHAWELEAGAVGIDKPWTLADERRTAFTPDPVLGVYINLARQLGGQRVVGRMPLGPGLHAMILDGNQGGMLAVWNENADEEPAELALYLGVNPVTVDPYGNTRPMHATDQSKHLLTVGSTPTIIRNIDPRIAMFRAGFTLDEPFIESMQVAHRRVLRIYNPWPRTLNGVYTITGPDRWNIQPQRKHISIAPGDTAEVPIAIRFPIHEDGGDKQLTADLVFNAGDDFDLTLHAPMELGLRGVEFDATVIVEPGVAPGTTDAVITLNVTNTSDKRQSLYIFAGLHGHARREMIVPGIDPGEFVSRTIRFKDVGDQVGQHPIRCGVRESKGPAVLNKTVQMLGPKRVDPPPAIVEAEAP